MAAQPTRTRRPARSRPTALQASWKQPDRLHLVGDEDREIPSWGQSATEIPPRAQPIELEQAENDDEEKADAYTRMKHKLRFLSEMIIGVDLPIVLAASTILTMLANRREPGYAWHSYLSESKAAIATLGAFYSFALVFRTNICYARWWEGRTLWGKIIVSAIRIEQQGRLWIEDKVLARRLGRMAIAFAYVCKAHLRANSIKDDAEDGAGLVRRGVLTRCELDFIHDQGAWQPFYCIDAMREVMNEGLLRDTTDDWRKNAAHQAMERTVCELSSSIGGCIRVRSTGLPVAYDDILNTIGAMFFAAACVAWAPGAGPYNPLVVLTVYVVVKMIVGVGNDMEDPFGHDESDLPLEKYCETIEKQIGAIDVRADTIPFSLAYGPPEEEMAPTYSSFAPMAHGDSSASGKVNGAAIDHVLETDPLLSEPLSNGI